MNGRKTEHINMEAVPVTAIFFSCRRLGLLTRCVDAFIEHNAYPIEEMIIVNDSGDEDIHRQLQETYPHFTLILNKENVGLMKSIDLGYAHIKTEYFFHCEDDWMVTKQGFMGRSVAIMKENPHIEEVWLADYNNHPLDSY
jgi:GT2 family glycosyltransferase